MFKNFLLVGLGGALGSMLRYGTYLLIGQKNFPYSTLLINIIGSLIIGVIIGFELKHVQVHDEWSLFLAVGICGGFTTFSSFSIENVMLLQSGKLFLSAIYIFSSLLICLGASWLGYLIGMKN